MSRWFAPLMAFCLSFLIIATLAPMLGIQGERQIDFWLLWLVSMVVLALPFSYLEIALTRRAKTTALQALSGLTRDADASPKWRVVGWLAVIFIPFLAGGILLRSSEVLLSQHTFALSTNVLMAGLGILALLLSFVARPVLLLLATIGVLVSAILANVLGEPAQSWQMTPIEFKEWGYATVLALVATGLGMGLYGQSSLAQVKNKEVVSKTVLPIWVAQLLAVLAFAFFSVQMLIPAVAFIVSAVAATAFMLQMAREQLAQRQLSIVIQALAVIVPLFIWAVPGINSLLNPLLLLWGLIIALIYAVFVGWVMKISHLRKALNFSNEAFYNVWRIAVRVVLPLAIILALAALIGSLR